MEELTEEIIDKIRDSLRISSKAEAITTDITDSIQACLMDLKAVGVVNVDQSDALIIRAIKLYCRADFDYNNQSEQFRKCYELQKMSLCLDSDYNLGSEV